jgi:hypothetical protein
MKRSRLTPFILFSSLIHVGVFIAADLFLRLPVEESETVELIPVEVVVAREDTPDFQPGLSPGERTWPQRDFQTRSGIVMETAKGRSSHEIARPAPKAGQTEPKVAMAGMQTAAHFAEPQIGRSAVSKPVLPVSQRIPLQIPPPTPSAPIESSILDVRLQAVFVKLMSKSTLTVLQDLKRLAPLLPASRPSVESGPDPPEIAATSTSEPHLGILMVPTLRSVTLVPQAEKATGKPVTPGFRTFSLDSSPVGASPPSTSSPADVKIPAVPTEAKAPKILVYPQPDYKFDTPYEAPSRDEYRSAEFPPMPRGDTGEPVLMVSMLKVHSQPNGAQVYVNGLLVGKTPLAWELPVGKHEVRLALPDYYDWKAQIELTDRHKTLPVFFRLLSVNKDAEE